MNFSKWRIFSNSLLFPCKTCCCKYQLILWPDLKIFFFLCKLFRQRFKLLFGSSIGFFCSGFQTEKEASFSTHLRNMSRNRRFLKDSFCVFESFWCTKWDQSVTKLIKCARFFPKLVNGFRYLCRQRIGVFLICSKGRRYWAELLSMR